MQNYFDILKNVCILAHEEKPLSFSDNESPYAEIKQYILNVVEEICSKFPWSFRERIYTFNTQAQISEYNLPANLPASNILENGVRISGETSPVCFVFHDDMDSLLSAGGKPYKYSVFAGKLTLYPVPDNVYSVKIKYLTANYAMDSEGENEKPNLLLEDDITIIPDRFIKTVEWGTYALFRQNYKPDNKYNLAREKFLEHLLDMKKQDGHGGDSSAGIVIS